MSEAEQSGIVSDLFLLFARKLNELGLTYMITGSVAGVLYGEPRVTHVVDIVVVLRPGPDIRRLSEAFPLEEFYCPPEEVLIQESLRAQRGHFNLIHHATGFRADIYLAGRDPLHRWALAERRQVEVDGETIWVAPPEYVIVRKLEFFRESHSAKHLADIAAILRVSAESLDVSVVQDWASRLGLEAEWKRARSTDDDG